VSIQTGQNLGGSGDVVEGAVHFRHGAVVIAVRVEPRLDRLAVRGTAQRDARSLRERGASPRRDNRHRDLEEQPGKAAHREGSAVAVEGELGEKWNGDAEEDERNDCGPATLRELGRLGERGQLESVQDAIEGPRAAR
jgi:hypothetical protein